MSLQLSCGDTCQIWMWFEESNMHFFKIENFAYGKINERGFSDPHPRFGEAELIFSLLLTWMICRTKLTVSSCQWCKKPWASCDVTVMHNRNPHLSTTMNYRKIFNIRRTLVGNVIVDHSDVVGASPVGAAPITSSLLTYLATRDSAKTTARTF